jgi:hypothetical protein
MKTKWVKRVVTVVLLAAWIVGLGGSAMTPTRAASEDVRTWTWHTAVSGGIIEDSSPVLADLDGDGKLEIVIGTTNMNGASPALVVLEDTGAVKWSVTLADPVRSSPAVADISYPPDGIPEIIVSTGGDVSQSRGSVVAFGQDRQNNRLVQLWKYDTTDAYGSGTPSGNWSSPTVGDVNNDGAMEIVFGSWDRNIYMLDHNGNRLWYYHVADSIWSTAALADLNHDGYLEIIIGTDITGGGILPDGYRPTDGGFVLILDKDGKKLARRQMNEAIYSSPAVGDVDGDGQLEIFCGTGIYWFRLGRYTQPKVYGFRVNMSGAEWVLEDLPGWPQNVVYPGWSSPALADLNNDGKLEVVIGTGYQGTGTTCSLQAADPNCHGALYAWNHDGTLLSGFPMWPTFNTTWNSYIRSSPVVADVDNDNSLEIVFAMLWDVIVVGSDGVQKSNLHTNFTVFGSPAIGDLDNDGRTDIVIGGSDDNDQSHGYVYNFEYGAGSYNASKRPWPMFHRDAQHTGRYPSPPELSVSPSSIYVLHQYGDANNEHAGLLIGNLGDGSISWSVSSKPGNVTVNPSGGTVYTSTLALVTVNATSYTTGTYSLNIVIAGTSGGSPIAGSPATIPVTLYVGTVYKTYLPVLMRDAS